MRSLAVRYRPKTWEDVCEQKSTIAILEEQVKTKTSKQVYLFCGPAGCGKTTSARILANELNNRQGNPIEIDAASNSSVEGVREIIEGAKFKSIESEYKVYIVDECHSLSNQAWQAFLRLIEEPPAQTVFIFCTTDPQKIPATILSRVQRYDFQRLSHPAVVERLKYILRSEGEEVAPEINHAVDVLYYEEEALEYISKLADGGMRDAITLLDKCLSYSTDITIQNVVEALGSVDYQVMITLTNAILDMEPKKAIIIIEEIHRKGRDLKQFIRDYLLFVLDLNKYGLLGDFEYLQIPSTLEEDLKAYDDDCFKFFNVLLESMIKLNTDIKWDGQPKSLIESSLIMLCKEE